MPFIRILIISLLIWIVYRIIRIRLDKRNKPAKPKPKIADMLPCQYCGLHIPAQESIQFNGLNYCSREHQKLDHQ